MKNLMLVVGIKLFNAKEKIKESASKNLKGEGFVDTIIKILIAVVIGALLLGLLYYLFKDTLFPKIAKKLEEMFDFNG